MCNCENFGFLGGGSFIGSFGAFPVSLACSMALLIFFAATFLPFLEKIFLTLLAAPLRKFPIFLKKPLLSEFPAIIPRKLRTSASCGSVKGMHTIVLL